MSLYAIGDLHLHFQSDLRAKARLCVRLLAGREIETGELFVADLLDMELQSLFCGGCLWGRGFAVCPQNQPTEPNRCVL